MAGPKFGGNEPGIYPIILRGIQKVSFLKFLNETRVKHIHLTLIRRKIQNTLQIAR